MEFVVVVAGLIIFNFAGSLAAIQQDRWCEAWLDRLHRSLGAKFTPWLLFAVSVFVPAAIILLIDRFVAGWFHGLVWLAFNLLVLLYAFGRGNLDDQLNSYLAHLERDDLQAAYHDAAAFNINHHEALAGNLAELQQETLRSIPYQYFERYFAVIFWYVLLGAAGAVLYRLSVYLRGRSLDQAAEATVAERWLWLMEWLPLRLTGLILAVVGNFARCIDIWFDQLFSKENTTAEVLGFYVQGALDIQPEKEEGAEYFADEVLAVKHLFNRGLIGMVCLLALLVLIS